MIRLGLIVRSSLCALLVSALLFAAVPKSAIAAVSVVVGGSPLYLSPGPIERAGRVFVPLRGIFERLGASVVYQNGQITSTKGDTNVSLHIGSTQATVNGQPQLLDVAPFIVGATTYVPLRFIAQSLGSFVNYDAATRVVAISAPHPRPNPNPPMPPPLPPQPPPVSIVHLRGQQPLPGIAMRNRFPTISAQFTHEVRPESLRIWLDGGDITSRCGRSSN
ncbi:MAG: copper amine oxidase N-terminal domain-containing protein, partial [Candidatus Eremiobacteraeota bacterium]|nr:copper amine oxidase N-terminal domain-containing protein [Candidatus Eremiobacteraeota bacterium]